MRVQSSKMRVFSVDRNIFRMKFLADFAYRNLHGFARFPGDSAALVIIAFEDASKDSRISKVVRYKPDRQTRPNFTHPYKQSAKLKV